MTGRRRFSARTGAISRHAADRRRAARDRARPASAMPGRTDVLLALFDPGTTVAGVFTRSKCPSAPVDWCRAKLKPGNGARPRGQFRQRQRLHRQVRPRGGQAHGRHRRQGRRLPAGRGLSRLDRRDRRAARCEQVRRRDGSTWSQSAAPGRWHDAATRDHDHRHLSEGRRRDRADRQRRGDHLRHRQGRRHDRARHGDHAVLRVHRRADRGAGAAGAAGARASRTRFNAVTIDGDTSTSDTLLAFATGAAAARGVPRITRASDPRLGALPQGASRRCSPTSPSRSRATARARASWSRSIVEGAASKTLGAPHRAVDRQLAAGQDRDRRRGRQLGPRRHGGRQGRRAGRSRQAVDLVRRHPRRPQGRARSRPMTRRRSRR